MLGLFGLIGESLHRVGLKRGADQDKCSRTAYREFLGCTGVVRMERYTDMRSRAKRKSLLSCMVYKMHDITMLVYKSPSY